MRNGYVHAEKMPRMQIKEMSRSGHEARMCRPGDHVRDKEKRKESTEGERQTASKHNDRRRSYAAHNAV